MNITTNLSDILNWSYDLNISSSFSSSSISSSSSSFSSLSSSSLSSSSINLSVSSTSSSSAAAAAASSVTYTWFNNNITHTDDHNIDDNGQASGTSASSNAATIDDDDANDDLRIHYPFLALFLALICLIIVLGNLLIMIAIRRERYLHTVTNLFVASLAFADCLVGAIVMPTSVVHEVMNKYWIFGQDWCDLWHSFDVLASTASILNLCVISLDRYWAITDPITYPARMTPFRAKVLIALVWTCSALISFPAIIWWRSVSSASRPLHCDFTEDIGYVVFSSIISFYGPLIVMLVVYFRIYRAAINQTKSMNSGTKQIFCDGYECTLRIHRGGGGGSAELGSVNITRTKFGNEITFKSEYSKDNIDSNGNKRKNPKISNDSSSTSTNTTSSSLHHQNFHHRIPPAIETNRCRALSARNNRNMKAFSISRKFSKLAKERKAAKTLGIVMGVFILCWLPFFLANPIKGICGSSCLIDPDLVYSLVTWLGWLNSAMNPVIYACWSRDFRRAFKKILCSCFHDEKNRIRTSKYTYSVDLGTKMHQTPKCKLKNNIFILKK